MKKIVNDFFNDIVNDAIKIMKKPKQQNVAYLFNEQQLECLKKNCKFEFEYKIHDNYISVWRKYEKIEKKEKIQRNLPLDFEKIIKKVDRKEISYKKACYILGMSYNTLKKYEQNLLKKKKGGYE